MCAGFGGAQEEPLPEELTAEDAAAVPLDFAVQTRLALEAATAAAADLQLADLEAELPLAVRLAGQAGCGSDIGG